MSKESVAKYPDIFSDLKDQVRAAGLLERIPIRGSIEMVAIIASMILIYMCIFHFILPPVSLPAFHFFESQTSI